MNKVEIYGHELEFIRYNTKKDLALLTDGKDSWWYMTKDVVFKNDNIFKKVLAYIQIFS